MAGQVWDIVEAVKAKLETMKVINGYLHDIGSVYISRKIEEQIPQTRKPAVSMIIGGESSIDRVGLETVDYIITFTFQIFCDGTSDTEAYHQVCDIWEDIKNAMYDDQFKTVHDYDTTHMNTSYPIVFPLDDKHASGVIAFAITYRDNYHA